MINKVDKDNGFISLAITRINPNAEFVIRNNNIDEIEWSENTTPISKSDIQTKINELEIKYNSENYIRSRSIAYPSLTEFAEAYCEKEIGGNSEKWNEYVTKYNKVRTDNPKE